jgi:putative transcriptional regulator
VESTARRLLVAAPSLLDPNFSRTVVFMIDHNDEGAVGVVLNRPTEADLEEAVPEWSGLAAPPRVAFLGGPVQVGEAVIGVARVEPDELGEPIEADGWQWLLGSVGAVDLARPPDLVRPRPVEARIFAGYAGWGPDQLEGELQRDDWIVVDALPADVLTPDPAVLWRAVLRRQGGALAMIANAPVDPSNN